MTGIDPSHVDLQHLANDHFTTTASGESSYIFVHFPSSRYSLPSSLQLILNPDRVQKDSCQ